MNACLAKLYAIGNKESRRIIGLMSGTSLDGLDIALCHIKGTGHTSQITLEHFTTVPYEESFKEKIRQVFAKPTIDFTLLCALNPLIAQRHAKYILDCLKEWNVSPESIDLIASHGQTVFHSPQRQHQISGLPNATLQIGDGDHIAVKTGIITISDFRQKHVAAGGEGAPLTAYGDLLLFSNPTENRILLNIGGIANFTYLPQSGESHQVFTADTGPGNTLIDLFTKKYFGKPYDENGDLARQGVVNEALLVSLKQHPYFALPSPKTTGPEVFNEAMVNNAIQASNQETITPFDLLATLTQFTADTIAQTIKLVAQQQQQQFVIYTSGGGVHNPVVMNALTQQLLTHTFQRIDTLGINGDAKEAILFAILANETVAGQAYGSQLTTETPKICMGKISFPF
jgi:anhydro-N-acetylmuramic acid kinase